MTVPARPVGGHGLLAGKVVLITGAGGVGVGSSTARRCAQEGAVVVISDADEHRLGAIADWLTDEGGMRPLAVVCDVTDEEAVQRLFDRTRAAHGGLDISVHNAGLAGSADLVDMTDEQWGKVLDVTLTGTFRCVRAALREMRKQGEGVIVNNASGLGWRAEAGQAHYAAASAGVMALTRAAAVEAAAFGVRVNAVAPSPPEGLTGRPVLGRAAEPWEIANAIVFLASDYSGYMTGEIMSVSSQHP